MRFLHILIILILVFFAHEFVFAESGRGAAIKDGAVQSAAGLGGMAAGYFLADKTCPNATTVSLCQIGIMMGVQSLGTLVAAPKNTNPTRDALNTGNYGAGSLCEADPSLCANNNNNTTLNPFDEPIVRDFQNLALRNGVDVNDPDSVQKFMEKNADLLSSMGGDGGSGGAGSMKMPADVQAKIDKYNKYIQSKYSVSAVGIEGGGGGRFPASAKSGKGDLDFNAFLEGLNPKDKTKDASLEGLQRNLASGEPVGVATENIFKQISRRYQAKRQTNLFLK
ncbi:MAG: hypothetical protein IPM57_05155 [Oligoflexia bacterium]|nr:hypothetical protein [Oligoflexia bacterium]